jgi:hypothetical protein
MAIYDHPINISVNKNDPNTLWRYMSLDNFELMLKEGSLFFCRADCFQDSFEGSLPQKEIEHRPKESKRLDEIFNQPIKSETEYQQKEEFYKQLHLKQRQSIAVNCWHMNDDENDAMWKAYQKEGQCVAIKTTITILVNTIQDIPENTGISKIRYIDYKKDTFYHPEEFPHLEYNTLTPLVHKRKGIYSFENELRLYTLAHEGLIDEEFWELQPKFNGIDIKIELNKLVQSVIISPYSVQLKSKVENLIQKYNYRFILEESTILSQPNF